MIRASIPSDTLWLRKPLCCNIRTTNNNHNVQPIGHPFDVLFERESVQSGRQIDVKWTGEIIKASEYGRLWNNHYRRRDLFNLVGQISDEY